MKIAPNLDNTGLGSGGIVQCSPARNPHIRLESPLLTFWGAGQCPCNARICMVEESYLEVERGRNVLRDLNGEGE